MKYLAYLVSLLIILAFNFGILYPLGLGQVVPSMLLIVVACLSLEYGSLDFFFFAIVGGLWMDVYFALPIGSFLGAYAVVGLVGYFIFQRLILGANNWKYYLVFIVGAEAFLWFWLWTYTNILYRLQWTAIALSGKELEHAAPGLLLAALISAIPIYLLINNIVQLAQRWLRRPFQLS